LFCNFVLLLGARVDNRYSLFNISCFGIFYNRIYYVIVNT